MSAPPMYVWTDTNVVASSQNPLSLSLEHVCCVLRPIYLFLVRNSFVQVARRKQIFTFLMNGNETIASVKEKISAVASQHDIPEASEDSMLLLEGKQTDADATLASLAANTKGASSEGLSFHLVYSIGDNEYEPVEVEPTRPAS